MNLMAGTLHILRFTIQALMRVAWMTVILVQASVVMNEWILAKLLTLKGGATC